MRFDPFDSGVNTWQYCCWDTDGGGGGGGGGSDDKKDTTPTFNNLTEAAQAGYHGQAVNIKGKGLQKVEFADKDYDKQMSNVSASTTPTATATTSTQPKSHDDFGTSVSKFLGFEEKDDGFYLDQVITQFNTMGPQKALERANYLKQSGLMNDVSLVDQTLNSLSQGGTGVVYSPTPTSTPISAPVEPEKTFNQAFAEARAKGQPTFPFDRDGDGVPESYTTELAPDPTVGGTVMPMGGPGTFTPGALPAAPTTDPAPFQPDITVTDPAPFQPNITMTDPTPINVSFTPASGADTQYNMFGDVVDDYGGLPDVVLDKLTERAASGFTPTQPTTPTFIPTGGPGTFGTLDDFDNQISPGQQQTVNIPSDMPTGGPGTFQVSTLPPQVDDKSTKIFDKEGRTLFGSNFLYETLDNVVGIDDAKRTTGENLGSLFKTGTEDLLPGVGAAGIAGGIGTVREGLGIGQPGELTETEKFLLNFSGEQIQQMKDNIAELPTSVQETLSKPIFETQFGPPKELDTGIPETKTIFNPDALAANVFLGAPLTLATVAAAPVLPAAVLGGGTLAMGEAKIEADQAINQAFTDGVLQETDQYKTALAEIGDSFVDASGQINTRTPEQQQALAVQNLKDKVNKGLIPVAALGAVSAYFTPKLLTSGKLGVVGLPTLEAGTEMGEAQGTQLATQALGGADTGLTTLDTLGEGAAAAATTLPLSLLGLGGSGVSTNVVNQPNPFMNLQTGQGPVNVQTTAPNLSQQLNLATQGPTTAPIVDLGTAGQFAQAPQTLVTPSKADTVVNIGKAPQTTQEMIIGTQLIENIINNSPIDPTTGTRDISTDDFQTIKKIADQTNMSSQMFEEIVETTGSPELVNPSVSRADLLEAQKGIANIIDTSPVDPVSGFKSPTGPQLEGIASLASGVNMDSSTLNKIVAQNEGAPYITPALSSLETPVQQDTPLNLEGISSLQTIPGEETVGVEGKPKVRVTKDGPRVDLGTTTDPTTTTDTVIEIPTDQNVTTTKETTTNITPAITVVEPEIDLDDDAPTEVEVDVDEDSTDTTPSETPSTNVDPTPTGPIVPPDVETDPVTGEKVYKCPDGYKLTMGKDGAQCFRTTTEQFMRAGIGTRAYTSVRPSRRRTGQKSIDIGKVETVAAEEA